MRNIVRETRLLLELITSIQGPEDVGNFDPEFTSERIRESMIVTGDQKPQRVNDSRFAGFYYSPANLGDHPVANAECAPAAADLAA